MIAAFGDTEDGRDCRQNERGIVQRGKVNEPDPIGKTVQHLGGELQGQARLARATWPGERQEARFVVNQAMAKGGELLVPPKDHGRLDRQVVGSTVQCLEWGKGGWQPRKNKLKDLLGT